MKKAILACVLGIVCLAVVVSAGSFEFKGTTDKMGIGEEMGDVLEAVTTAHLADLKAGSITTKEGATKYSQFIRFRDTATAINASDVQFTKSVESGETAEFLVVDRGTAVTDAFFEWHISFDEGLKSKKVDNRLDGLDEAKISVFSDEYTIIDSLIDNRKIKLMLAKGAINDLLRQQEKKVYTIGSKAYEIEVSNIEVSTKKVKFKVGGKETPQMQKGSIESIDAGVFIGVTDIIPNSNNPSGSAVKLFIGASVLEITDENYEDDSFTRDVMLNKKKIESAFVKIAASFVGDIIKISSLKYRLINPTTLYVKPGEGVKKYLKEQEGMLADWDIRFAGLEVSSTSKIKLIPSASDDEYRLEFTTVEGKTINLPFVSNKGSFKLGDNTRDLIVAEGTAATDFTIERNDYVVLSTANGKNGKTYVLTYDSLNNETNTIVFTEIGGSQKTVTYSNSSNSGTMGEGTLSLGAINTKFYIEEILPNRIAIDLNGDGDVNTDAMDIITKGGGIIDVGLTNSPTAPYDFTITTDGSQFEESTTSETITFTIQTSQATRIGVSETVGGMTTFKSSANKILGLSSYGVRIDLQASPDKADALTVDYPMSQMFAKVVIDVGASGKIATKVEQSKETQCTNGKQDADETGIDCGGSCNACPTCSDGIKNQGEEGIDCGGPCSKACTTQEKKTEACTGCWQTLEKGAKKCLSFGTVVNTLYCDKAGLLVPLKKNGVACVESYECKTGRCEEGKCGRKMSTGLLAMNIGIVILILVILYYAFALLK